MTKIYIEIDDDFCNLRMNEEALDTLCMDAEDLVQFAKFIICVSGCYGHKGADLEVIE